MNIEETIAELNKEQCTVVGEQPPAENVLPAEPASSRIRREVIRLALLAFMIGLFLCLSTYSPNDPSLSTWTTEGEIQNWMGGIGSILADFCFQGFGFASYFLCLFLLVLLVPRHPSRFHKLRIGLTGAGCLLSLATIFETLPWSPKLIEHAGGLVGYSVGAICFPLLGKIGTFLAALVILFSSLTILLGVPLFSTAVRFLWQKLRTSPLGIAKLVTRLTTLVLRLLGKNKTTEEGLENSQEPTALSQTELAQTNAQNTVTVEKTKEPRLRLGAKFRIASSNKGFQIPSIKLLSQKAASKSKTVDKSWYLERGEILVQKLRDFGVEGEIVNIAPGPVITVYEFKPASGVKIREIANLSDDLTLALSALSVRIVAPIPGKPVVGIEIPSPNRELVLFRELVNDPAFNQGEHRIPIALGRSASGGDTMIGDLASMPHLLVAGATGTGKSVFVNTLISSLLFRFTPQQLKLILVDPKMVELSQYDDIPHLLLPVVVDSKKAAMALRWLIEEMERRYTLLHQFGVRHVDAYNQKIKDWSQNAPPATPSDEESDTEAPPPFLPYIVTVIDEYADLMAVVPKEVELSIARLAQKARASGIHLVLATQRPSTDVVTGTIKANFPCRISFRVATSVDSKTILDRAGAERLLGNGDLLFLSPGFNTLKRLQGPYLTDNDTNRIVSFLCAQGKPEYDDAILDPPEEEDRPGGGKREDKLYDEAVRIVAEKGEASISLIQRHLRIGYNRAATLMEQMEKDGVVGHAQGNTKRRSVLVSSH